MKSKVGGYAKKWVTTISDLPADELRFVVGAAMKKLMSLGYVSEKHATRILREMDSTVKEEK